MFNITKNSTAARTNGLEYALTALYNAPDGQKMAVVTRLLSEADAGSLDSGKNPFDQAIVEVCERFMADAPFMGQKIIRGEAQYKQAVADAVALTAQLEQLEPTSVDFLDVLISLIRRYEDKNLLPRARFRVCP